VQGLGFRAQGVGHQVRISRFGVYSARFWVQGAGLRILGFEFQGSGYKV